MENNLFLTLLGFALSFFIDIANRNKRSRRTPSGFSIVFFIKDNYLRYIFSGGVSLILVLIYHRTSFDFESQQYEDLFTIAVGFCPDLVISYLKRKIGFLKK